MGIKVIIPDFTPVIIEIEDAETYYAIRAELKEIDENYSFPELEKLYKALIGAL